MSMIVPMLSRIVGVTSLQLITINSSEEGIRLSPVLEERTALLSDVHGVCVYLVGD